MAGGYIKIRENRLRADIGCADGRERDFASNRYIATEVNLCCTSR